MTTSPKLPTEAMIEAAMVSYYYHDPDAATDDDRTDMIAAITAALAVAPSQEGWQPIATAPIDGTEIIYRTSEGQIGRCYAEFKPGNDDEVFWWDTDADQTAHALWWMPNPKPPAPLSADPTP